MTFTAKTFNELTTSELYEILKARATIFFLEQDIKCQDMDDVDYKSLHCFLHENNLVCGYLRAFRSEGSADTVTIGRVLTLQHGVGLGRTLMEKSLAAIKGKMPCKRLYLHAQKQVIGFYDKFGFCTISDEFLEENIPHVEMELTL